MFEVKIKFFSIYLLSIFLVIRESKNFGITDKVLWK